MLSAYFQLCFAVLLTAFCHVQPLVPLHHNTLVHGLNDETRCRWNCTVIDSDLTEEMKSTIANKKFVRLLVKYEKNVDNKCVNQTSRNSSGKGQIWLLNKQLSTFTTVLESLANLMSCDDSNEEHKVIRAICTLRPAGTTGPEYNSGSQFPMFSQGHLSVLGVELNSTHDCNTEETDNSHPCINITNSTGNNEAYSLFDRGGWPVAVFYCFCVVFVAVFVHYSPAFLCLFSPTEVIEDGVRQIILEGASPVSVRSLLGNYFFSEDDGTIWHKARTFFFRVVIMTLPFLGPAIFIVVFGSLTRNLFFQRIIPLLCSCYFIHAIYISFFTARSVQMKPCKVCKIVKPKIFNCQDELPQLIMGHLRLQPFILMKCWRLFIQYVLRYCKMSLIVLPSWKFSSACLFRFPIFVVFLSTIPAVTLILLIAILLLAFGGIVFSSPIVILSRARNTVINVPFSTVLAIHYCINTLATTGATLLISLAGVGTLVALLKGFALLLSEEGLPYVACFVLVFYYVWSSYSFFTSKYQDLALGLFKHYKKSRHHKFDANNTALNSNQVQVNIAADYDDNVIKIPKELYHMACEELMPIREAVCMLILEISSIVSLVFLVFSIIVLRDNGATPIMKALVTFFTGFFPKIVAIDGGRKKKIEAMATDEKIPRIVREYINKRSGPNRGQENNGADVDEVMLLDLNDVNIELVNL